MSPRIAEVIVALLGACVLCCGVSVAVALQPHEPDPVDVYLEQTGLDVLLETHLQDRLDHASAAHRGPLADRLARVYARRLDTETDDKTRARLILKAHELLGMVPDAAAYDLRLALAIAQYEPAERTAERHRLRLANADRVVEAAETMAALVGDLHRLAAALDNRVSHEQTKKRAAERRGRIADQKKLAEYTRLRSLAHYYAGWCGYYGAGLTDDPERARGAIADFAWLLDSPDKPPTLERLPRALLRYDHIARSAVGVALCMAVNGQHERALVWLDEIEKAPNLPGDQRNAIKSQRLVVLASAARFEDLARAIADARRADDIGALSVTDARLVALVSLDALRANLPSDKRRQAALDIARSALGDLVARGQMAQVLDLLDRYGSLPLTGRGFVIDYVRGVERYELARTQQAAAGESALMPTEHAPLRKAYEAAATHFRRALDADDADRYPGEAAGCGLLLGRCLFAAGKFEKSASVFLEARDAATDQRRREEAHWMAIVVLDTVSQDDGVDQSIIDRRDELARAFLADHPGSRRGPALLLRLAGAGIVSTDDAIEMLAKVEPDDPIAAAARQHLANLLYGQWRRSAGVRREQLATRFLDTATPMLDELGVDVNPTALIVRARQVLDVAIGSTPPITGLAREVIAMLRQLIDSDPASPAQLRAEVLYRLLQVALLEDRQGEASETYQQLAAVGGKHADAGQRLVFTDAVRRWEDEPANAQHMRRVVEIGLGLLEQSDLKPRSLLAASVREKTSHAAAHLWQLAREERMRATALRLCRRMRTDGQASRAALLRLAALAETIAAHREAADAWLDIMNAAPAGSLSWYEARYESLRLLAVFDAKLALAAIEQHRVLYPSLGPEPWGARIADLQTQLQQTQSSLSEFDPGTQP